ncbi:phosphoribosylglycinamide formyltransferase [Anaerolentibacter hominis]|uniref:phosphoribosylglycinamide formyltransferase n=1 Tax=Anaerolentibacter hominis TaxID=3079009 RepID=UPI0031B80F0C
MLKIGVLVSGGGTNLQAIIDAMQDGRISNAGLSVVISNKPGVYALTRAADAGIPSEVLSPKSFGKREDFDQALLNLLRQYDVDLVVLAGFLVILPELVVEEYQNRIVNIHPSLIPSFSGMGYYGLKVHEAVLARGCKVTGATVHFVDAGADTGPIILQKAVNVEDEDTPEILQKRVMEQAEWKILPEAINLIANHCLCVDGNVVRRKG